MEKKKKETTGEKMNIYPYRCMCANIPLPTCTRISVRYRDTTQGKKTTGQKVTAKGDPEARTQYREVEIQKPTEGETTAWNQPLDRPSSPGLKILRTGEHRL